MSANVLGVVVDENNRVLEVEPDNAAAKGGVQVGDLLDSLDGISFQDKVSVKARIQGQNEGAIFKLMVQRNDQSIILEIGPMPPVARFNAPTPTPVFAPQDYF